MPTENKNHPDDHAAIERLHQQYVGRIERFSDDLMAFQDAAYAMGLERGKLLEAKRVDALQQRLTAADEQIDELTRPQSEQMACMPVERCYDVRAKMIIAFNEAKKTGGDLDDALDAAYKSALRYSPNPLYAEQSAPVAVVLPADWQDQLLDEMTTRFELNKHDDDHMVYDDTQIGVKFARDWIAKRLNTK